VTTPSTGDDYPALLQALAAAQRLNALALRELVGEAHAAGVTWRQIGDALGIPGPTAFRQHQAGSPIVVARAFHPKRESEENGR
jgi:hypothetical protein